jgi:hypothetical protein
MTCVPTCNSTTHGYELLATIDGTDTKFSCTISSLLYSWVGAAALGGFLGQNVAAFVSAVISGAAGAYAVTLTEDADIVTDLTIQPGQNVIISGDVGFVEAATLSWGTSTFTIGELASLSLTHLSLGNSINVLDGGHLSIISCIGTTGTMITVTYSTLVVFGTLSVTSLRVQDSFIDSSTWAAIDFSDTHTLQLFNAGNVSLYGKNFGKTCQSATYNFINTTVTIADSTFADQISLSTRGALSLISMPLPNYIVTQLMRQPVSARNRIRFSDVWWTEFPNAGAITGVLTASVTEMARPLDIGRNPVPWIFPAGRHWVQTPPNFLPQGPFTVLSGPCSISSDGRCVGRPDGYRSSESCEISAGAGGPLTCPLFDTEQGGGSNSAYGNDYVTLDAWGPPSTVAASLDGGHHSRWFNPDRPCSQTGCLDVLSTSGCPEGVLLAPGATVGWTSSYAGQGGGHGGLPATSNGNDDDVGGGWLICFAQ